MKTGNNKIHLFLTGEKQVGKSTLIKKLIEKDSRKQGGFFTVRMFYPNEGLWYTHLLRPGEKPSPDNILFCCSDKKCDSTERFNKLGCRALESPGELIIMDELGPHEENAVQFKEAVFKTLDGDIPILGVLQKAESMFLKAISEHEKVNSVEVTKENRDLLFDELSEYIVSKF